MWIQARYLPGAPEQPPPPSTPPRARREAASHLSISGSEAGRCEGAGADVAGGSGGRSAPVYCSRCRRVLPFPAPAGPRREGGRTDSRTERTEPLRQRRRGGGGRRERAGGGAARGPLTRFRLSAARARAASARVTPERKRDSPGAAARERPWPTRTSSSTSSSETQVGEPGPARAGAGRGAERKARLPAPISAVLAVPPTWWLRARKRRCLPPASAPGPARGLGLVSRWPWAAGSRLRAWLKGRGAARAVSPPQRRGRRRCHNETYIWVMPRFAVLWQRGHTPPLSFVMSLCLIAVGYLQLRLQGCSSQSRLGLL